MSEVSADQWETLRDLRLAALKEAPWAFGSTHAREVAFGEEQWRGRIGSRGVTYFAYLDETAGKGGGDRGGDPEPAGLAGVYEADGVADLVSMWVRPAARGRKAAEALITACATWARARGHVALYLWVTASNAAARKLYERCGFTPTGESQPLPSDPALPEIRMSRPL